MGTDGYYRPLNQGDRVTEYRESLKWDHGEHSLDLGASFIRRTWNNFGSGPGLGMWIINDLPSLLQGQFLQVQREVDLDTAHYLSWEPSAYLQEQWKALPRLTLNAGLRYDIFTPPTESRNRMNNFDLATGEIVVASQNGVSRTAGVKTDYRGVAPRLGFNWRMLAETTLIGGFGIVYFRPIDNFFYKAPPFIYSFGTCSSQTCPDGFTSLAAGLPFVQTPDANNPSGTLIGMRSFDLRNSYVKQLNLGIERQHRSDTFRIFYVGVFGRDIARSFPDINAPPPNTAANPNALRPFYPTVPNLATIAYVDTEGSSSYNALQASFAHAYEHGLTAQFNYTWAHGLDDVGGPQAGFGTVPALSSKLDYGNSSYDVRQRLAATMFYELPFGKAATGICGWLIRSWQVNLSGVWSTGLPFTVVNATDASNTNPGASAADRPDQVAKATLKNPAVAEFFNTAAFVRQLPGTLGNEASNQLYGPHNRRLDISLFKNVRIGKEAAVQFRAEVFNATNTVNFAAPASVLGAANFGQLTQMTAGYAPRQVQLALRFQF